MDLNEYFRSLSAELDATKNRVRHMIDDAHWPTDGEWKESVLRSVLRRSAPSSVSIGRGFIVSELENTSQLDVLIHDNSHPVLYRDGDLVFATAASCRAVIEVKTNLNRGSYQKACRKLAKTAQLIRAQKHLTRTFVGLFSYGVTQLDPQRAAEIACSVADGDPARVIDHISLGDDVFLKYWNNRPGKSAKKHEMNVYNSWHAYRLPRMAAGYFIHNLLMHLSANQEIESDAIWFPQSGKESGLAHAIPLR